MAFTTSSSLLIATTILYIKYIITLSIQGKKAFSAGTRPPEDVSLSLSKNQPAQTYGQTEDPKLKFAMMQDVRWRRIVLNDVENIPFGLIVFLVSRGTVGSEVLFHVCVLGFALVRCIHTFAYAYEIQPTRGLMWLAGITSVFVTALNGLSGVF